MSRVCASIDRYRLASFTTPLMHLLILRDESTPMDMVLGLLVHPTGI
jgi:hypothetical protein